jgi:plasmid stabilization system protein ParE
MQVIIEPAAHAELREALVWYLEVAGIRHAEAFEQVIDAKLTLLIQHPHMGTQAGNNIYALPLLMFPYTIYYRVEPDTIRVLAVAHQRRKPGYWQRRR